MILFKHGPTSDQARRFFDDFFSVKEEFRDVHVAVDMTVPPLKNLDFEPPIDPLPGPVVITDDLLLDECAIEVCKLLPPAPPDKAFLCCCLERNAFWAFVIASIVADF